MRTNHNEEKKTTKNIHTHFMYQCSGLNIGESLVRMIIRLTTRMIIRMIIRLIILMITKMITRLMRMKVTAGIIGCQLFRQSPR